MIDAIDKKEMCYSVITGKENTSKEWNCIIAMVLTSFNVYFLIGYAYFMCICCKTAIRLFLAFFGTRSGFFGEDRLATLCRSPLREVSWWPSIACALLSEPICFEITMDMRKWIQRPVSAGFRWWGAWVPGVVGGPVW